MGVHVSGFAGSVGAIMKNAEPEKDSGGLVPLVRKSLSEVTGGVGLNPRFSPSHAQLNDHAGHLLRNYGLPASTLPHPFHLAAISSRVYPPSLFGAGLNPAALLASLSRTNNLFRNTPTSDYPIIPPSSSHSLANLHAVLATGDPCRHSELLKNSARQHELLSALTKVAASTSSTSPLSPSTSTSPLSTSFNLTSSNGSPSKLSKDTSPLDKFSRASSLSPSSYMTPRSLNGSPSGPASNTPNFNSLVHSSSSLSTLESLSPTSPSTEGEGSGNSLSSGATPTRKVSTPRPDRVFTCKICSRSFGYKHVLQNHERTHTGEKPFECKECHKRFTRDHHLKTHMRLHTGEKPYHCTHCDRQFVQVANLRRHLRVHTGEKPYTCETCSSKFSDSNQLKAHILIHKGEKPFGCNKCSGKFRRRHHLIHHKCPNGLDSHFNDTPVTMLPDNYNFSFDDSLYHNDIEDEDIDDRMHLPSSTSMLGSTNEDEPLRMGKRRVRKCKEPRRIVSDVSPRLSSPSLTDTILNTLMPLTPQPEQTEPEDLSINGSRRDYQNHMYRANIALTSSRYMKSPFKYPSSIADHQDLSQNKEFGAISGQL